MSYKFESDVIKTLGELLENKVNCDVIVRIGQKPNFKEFHGHSIILGCRSKYFNEILFTEYIRKKDGKYIITKQNLTPQAFDVILKYLYTGHFNINAKTGYELLDIMVASEELKLEQLTKLTEEFIMGNYQQFLQSEPVGVIRVIYYNKSFYNLQEYCLQIISSEPEILFNKDIFIKLPALLLESVLRRDDLNLSEIEIWDNLIKWGSTIKIIPRISARHSVIIDQALGHFAVFANWIDKMGDHNKYTTKTMPYKFNLLYRLSRDDRRDTKTASVGYSGGISSVGCYSTNGPIFGGYFYCRSDGSIWTAYSTNYFNLSGFPNKSIIAEDYEVFQVIKQLNM
ncbi:unnamed protein product [Rhizophagus irregularis]|nr:unnamed protein product [Rhizophagus irregularis]